MVPNPPAPVPHIGFTQFSDLLVFKELEAYPWSPRNVWYDVSATASLFADSAYEEELVWTVRKLGVDRVMFGSDFPIHTTSTALVDVERLGFTPDEERAILHDTAAALLGL